MKSGLDAGLIFEEACVRVGGEERLKAALGRGAVRCVKEGHIYIYNSWSSHGCKQKNGVSSMSGSGSRAFRHFLISRLVQFFPVFKCNLARRAP